MPTTMSALTQIEMQGLKHLRSGKVREVFDLDEHLLMVATDRVSAFDVVLPNGIPDKGKILNQLSAFWFTKLEGIVPNHMVSIDDGDVKSAVGDAYNPALAGRSMIVKKCEPVMIESVARSYIAGSLYKEYVAGGGMTDDVQLHGISLPKGLLMCERLPETIYTPATKAHAGHDENVSYAEAAAIAGAETIALCKTATLRLFQSAQAICDSAGIILADTKFEFGICGDDVTLIDEALTPDSSRFWQKEKYVPGRSQESLDKQFIRDYLETLDWDKSAPGPELPQAVITETRARYIDIFERTTGSSPRL